MSVLPYSKSAQEHDTEKIQKPADRTFKRRAQVLVPLFISVAYVSILIKMKVAQYVLVSRGKNVHITKGSNTIATTLYL